MALRVGLAAYRFEMKEKRAPAWWTFQLGSATDAYAQIGGYAHSRKGRVVRLGDQCSDGTYADQRAILLTRPTSNRDRRLQAGLILKGEAGVVREIRDFDDPEGDPKYKTGVNEGILTPLYYRFHLEDGRNFGVALLQTLSTDGLKGYIDTDLRRYFSSDAGTGYSHRLTQLVDIKVLERFAQEGKLQDVVLINSGKTAESRKAMEKNTIAGDTLGTDGDKLAFRMHRKDGWKDTVLRKLLQAIQRNEDPRSLVDVPAMGEIDDLQVEINQGGRTQTFSLLHPDDSPIRYDITDKVQFGEDGLPTWQSLHRAADAVWDGVRSIIETGD